MSGMDLIIMVSWSFVIAMIIRSIFEILDTTKPKFKEGDWVQLTPDCGEFSITENKAVFLIKKVGKKNYLCNFYGKHKNKLEIIQKDKELKIHFLNGQAQKIDISELKINNEEIIYE